MARVDERTSTWLLSDTCSLEVIWSSPYHIIRRTYEEYAPLGYHRFWKTVGEISNVTSNALGKFLSRLHELTIVGKVPGQEEEPELYRYLWNSELICHYDYDE